MPNFNLNLYEAWDELDELTEAEQDDADALDQMIRSNSNSLQRLIDQVSPGQPFVLGQDENDAVVIKLAKLATKKFNRPEREWPYELQLLCNAKISQDYLKVHIQHAMSSALSLISEKDMNNKIKDLLIKDTNGNTTLSGNKFYANNNEVNQNQLFSPVRKDANGKTIANGPDLLVRNNTNNKATASVEVKTTSNSRQTAGSQSVSSYHNADIVFIISIKPPKPKEQKEITEAIQLHEDTDGESQALLYVKFNRSNDENHPDYTKPMLIPGFFPAGSINFIRVDTSVVTLSSWF